MSTQQQQQQGQQEQHQQQQNLQYNQPAQKPERVSVGTSTSPLMGAITDTEMNGLGLGYDNHSMLPQQQDQQQHQQQNQQEQLPAPPPPPPLVITTTNEDGNEVGFYYAVPSVNLNPAYSDADLFHDFTMMDALGEDFVWIENLFDDPSPEEAAAQMTAMSVAAAAGQELSSTVNDSNANANINTTTPITAVDVSGSLGVTGADMSMNALLNNPAGDVAMTMSSSTATTGGEQPWMGEY
ncbi:hypothetical protein BGZ94_001216 [Podila epigama]|nr:hypothetical protein BGZ94_001216 [Podila epigama]